MLLRTTLLMSTSAPNHRGVSLAEMAIVLAVTGLLFGLGASAYRTYVVRGQITQSLALAARAQAQVAESFRRDGEPPADRVAAGQPRDGTADRGTYVESIEIVDGRIDLRFGGGADPSLKGRTLSLDAVRVRQPRRILGLRQSDRRRRPAASRLRERSEARRTGRHANRAALPALALSLAVSADPLSAAARVRTVRRLQRVAQISVTKAEARR